MRDFEYESPTSLADALQLLQRPGTRPLAGGTDLIDHLRTERVVADCVIDVKHIPELNVIAERGDAIHLGAATPCRVIQRNSLIQEQAQAIHDVCCLIGGVQIQSRASIGGNVCSSGAAADSTPALIAINAACEIAGPHGTRTVTAEDFCTGPNTNVLESGELLVGFRIPKPAPRTGSHYQRFIPRYEMDIAVVGVGAKVTLDESGQISEARIGLGAVAPSPFLAAELGEYLQGKTPSDKLFEEAGERARQLIHPINDHRGTAEFRTHVTGVLVKRVLTEAVRRAEQQQG